MTIPKALAVKLRTLSLRAELLRYRTREVDRGWDVPRVVDILRSPHLFEPSIAVMRFLDPHAEARALIDVGANDGSWAHRFLRYVPCDEVFLIEPDPRVLADLRSRVPRGEVIAACAGRESGGTTALHLADETTYSTVSGYTGISARKRQLETSVDLPTIAVADLPFRSLGVGEVVMKLDVQGAEMDALRGSEAVLPHVDVIIAETPLVPQTGLENDLGRIAGYLRGWNLVPAYFGLPGLGESDVPIEFDTIFVRRERFTRDTVR